MLEDLKQEIFTDPQDFMVRLFGDIPTIFKGFDAVDLTPIQVGSGAGIIISERAGPTSQDQVVMQIVASKAMVADQISASLAITRFPESRARVYIQHLDNRLNAMEDRESLGWFYQGIIKHLPFHLTILKIDLNKYAVLPIVNSPLSLDLISQLPPVGVISIDYRESESTLCNLPSGFA